MHLDVDKGCSRRARHRVHHGVDLDLDLAESVGLVGIYVVARDGEAVDGGGEEVDASYDLGGACGSGAPTCAPTCRCGDRTCGTGERGRGPSLDGEMSRVRARLHRAVVMELVAACSFCTTERLNAGESGPDVGSVGGSDVGGGGVGGRPPEARLRADGPAGRDDGVVGHPLEEGCG